MTLPGKDTRLVPYGGANFGMPLGLIDGLIVPTSHFFVRSNGPVPEIDASGWRLTVSGNVVSPLRLSLTELQALPTRTITSFLECAGNSRTRYQQVAEGTPWLDDAVGCATWTGTSLRNVIDIAGIGEGTVDIVAQGGDMAEMQRGLPLATALDPDVLLAWAMNGEPLTAPHGAPVRLIVPRWGGIASTKWLSGLTLVDQPFTGYYNAVNYVMISERGEHLAPVREMPVKSVIVSPVAGARVSRGSQTVTGYAWSGFGGISRVEVSFDEEVTWSNARIVGEAGPLAWVRWSLEWDASPGPLRILARATDARTLTQPRTAAWNAKGYQMNAIHEVAILVE